MITKTNGGVTYVETSAGPDKQTYYRDDRRLFTIKYFKITLSLRFIHMLFYN